MARILHTADLHLTESRPERMRALETILEEGREREIDLLTIGGDIFHDPVDAEDIRTDLRNHAFRDLPFQVLIIPGNHDGDIFDPKFHFGDSTRLLIDEPIDQWISPDRDLRVIGIPYRERPDDELMLALKNRENISGTDILMLHCSLEAPFQDQETGEEDTIRYFPVTTETLADLEFDYYLAGHFHNARRKKISSDSLFFYPGTPASTRTSETGVRRAVYIDTTEDIADLIPLDTFRYERETFEIIPGHVEETLETLSTWVKNNTGHSIDARITVQGFHDWDESTFSEKLQDLADPVPVEDQTRNVEPVLSHPLYQTFLRKLEDRDWEENTREAVRRKTIHVFSKILLGG